jgi:malonate-semialdehyde dehydrogenase (acetylating)/methylmalonate-semialdehyde dehydrogenase
MQGRNLENVATNIDCETYRQPIGVFGAICPFNFPAMVPMWFLPFAVACGNTFVLKPSEQVPLAQEAIFKLIHELELLPPGVINLVNGGREVVEGICDHPGMAGSVLVTVGSAHERILPPLIAAAEALRVGNGLEKGVGVGPLVSSDRRDIVRSWIDKGEAEGASIVLDGRTENGDNSAGAFVGPTIMDDVTPSMDVAREEIFGPVLSVVKVDTLDEAIAVVNGSRYGNGSSIFTESGAVARRYRHDCDAGMIGVNIGVAAPVAFFPFSGWKDSFLGDLHAHGGDAIDFYTRKTTVTTRWNSQGESGKFFVE